MKKLCLMFCLFTFTITLSYAAGKADDVVRVVAKKLSRELLEAGGKKADDAIRYASRNADNWVRAGSSRIDDISRLAARNVDNVARIGIQRGDDVIRNFSEVHGRRIAQTLGTKTDNVARTVVTHADEGVRVVVDNLAQRGFKTGGYYGELKGVLRTVGQPGSLAVHHMPAQSAIKGANLWNGDIGKAPSIIMDQVDHLKTASHGFSKSAQSFQTIQENLIKQGRFADALQMDVDDLIAKGLYPKYENGIKQMQEYIDVLRRTGDL